MRKSIIILGITALMGVKSMAFMSMKPSTSPTSLMTAVAMGIFDEKESSEVDELVRFRKEVIQPTIEGKDVKGIVDTLMNMDEKKFLRLVRDTNRTLRVSINIVDNLKNLSKDEVEKFNKESAVLDTWAGILVRVYEERI